MCIDHIDIMSTLVNQLTIEQAHKEYNSLVDKIAAKYQQLNSAEFGVVGNLSFNAKSAKLPSLFAHMSQLCQRLHLPMPTQLHRLPCFKHWRVLFRSKFVQYAGRQSYCVEDAALFPNICEKYWVSECPSFLRIGSWLCVLSATTLVIWQVPES